MSETIIVTGGTRGLGIAIVRELSSVGYTVVAVGRKHTDEIKRITADSSNVTFESYDLTDIAGLHDFTKHLSNSYKNIYGLVNNAAIGTDGILATMHESDIHRLIQLNIEAPIVLTKYMLRPMLVRQKGRVINISSIIASTGYKGLSVYGATKSAMIGFTKSLSREVGRMGITVNSVAPGYMETNMTQGLEGEKLESIKRRSPLGKLVDVNDVAHIVKYLASEEASMITGTTMTVDAGSTA